MIVWLIENQGLSTKERMFEVYLNLIEWGPLIYGANEASHYYFNKDDFANALQYYEIALKKEITTLKDKIKIELQLSKCKETAR